MTRLGHLKPGQNTTTSTPMDRLPPITYAPRNPGQATTPGGKGRNTDMKVRLAVLAVLVCGGLGAFAASPAIADPQLVLPSPGNSKDGVAVCNAIVSAGFTYPYEMRVFNADGLVGSFTVKNKGACVSVLAQNQDWTVVVVP